MGTDSPEIDLALQALTSRPRKKVARRPDILDLAHPPQTPVVSTEGVLQTPAVSTEGVPQTPAVSTEGVLQTPVVSTEGALQTPVVSTEGALQTPVVSVEEADNKVEIPEQVRRTLRLDAPDADEVLQELLREGRGLTVDTVVEAALIQASKDHDLRSKVIQLAGERAKIRKARELQVRAAKRAKKADKKVP